MQNKRTCVKCRKKFVVTKKLENSLVCGKCLIKLPTKQLDLLADKENITTSDFQGCLDVIERQALEL